MNNKLHDIYSVINNLIDTVALIKHPPPNSSIIKIS